MSDTKAISVGRQEPVSLGKRAARARLTSIEGLALGVCLLGATYSTLLFHRRLVDVLTREEGVFETLGAAGLLAASIITLLLYRRARKEAGGPHPLALAALALLFFAAAGEEISWGQHIFHFGTPTDLATVNRQDEVNLHDIGLFEDASNLGFNLFWLGFGLLVPLADAVSDRARGLLRRVVPIVPIWVGVLLLLNHVFAQLVRVLLPDSLYHGSEFLGHRAIEIKESNAEVLFAIGVFWVLHYGWSRHRRRLSG